MIHHLRQSIVLDRLERFCARGPLQEASEPIHLSADALPGGAVRDAAPPLTGARMGVPPSAGAVARNAAPALLHDSGGVVGTRNLGAPGIDSLDSHPTILGTQTTPETGFESRPLSTPDFAWLDELPEQRCEDHMHYYPLGPMRASCDMCGHFSPSFVTSRFCQCQLDKQFGDKR